MIRRLFLEHPASVGESYFEHASFAARFGWTMFIGSMACFVHAMIPALCQSTGSSTVLRLHDRLMRARARQVERDARSDSARTADEKR